VAVIQQQTKTPGCCCNVHVNLKLQDQPELSASSESVHGELKPALHDSNRLSPDVEPASVGSASEATYSAATVLRDGRRATTFNVLGSS
jgi:hypothetical protein